MFYHKKQSSDVRIAPQTFTCIVCQGKGNTQTGYKCKLCGGYICKKHVCQCPKCYKQLCEKHHGNHKCVK